MLSPSLRGRGLKYVLLCFGSVKSYVALFTRAWIEIVISIFTPHQYFVALFTRAWIEITACSDTASSKTVALFTRAWIEIRNRLKIYPTTLSPSLRGRGLK